MGQSRSLYDKAKLDPAQVFDSPADLAASHELTRSQKIDLLRRWAYDAEEMNVAEAENMSGKDSDLFDQILTTLHDLDALLQPESPRKS